MNIFKVNTSEFQPFLAEICNYKLNFICTPNSCFARKLDWERNVTLNHGKMRWATALTQMNPEPCYSYCMIVVMCLLLKG